MTESVLLSLPAALALYGLALALSLLERRTRTAGQGAGLWLTRLSAVLALCATAYGLIYGVPLREAAAALCVFLLADLEVGG